jgi:hypothetical protein
MIVKQYYIEKYDWVITAYYAVSRYYVTEIMSDLEKICKEDTFLYSAYHNLKRNSLNSGLTYSNYKKKESIMVVALASSAKQFHMALMHEIMHLQSHIATAYSIDEKSEEVCYLLDDIVGEVHKDVAPLICECCRKKDVHNGRS